MKISKKHFLLIFTLISTYLSFCTVSVANTLIISTENTPNHFQVRHLKKFAQTLSNEIDILNFKVVDSARAFRGRDVVMALSNNKVAIAAPGIWHLSRFVPDTNGFLLPRFIGMTAKEIRPYVDGAPGLYLNGKIEQALNVKVFGRWLDLGPAHIFTRAKKVTRNEDLTGLKIRYAGGVGNAERLKLSGIDTILVPWSNVPHELKMQTIDGLLTTASSVKSAALWDKGIKYAFLSHSYYPFYIPMISKNVWDRLTPEMQQSLRDTWEALIEEGRQDAEEDQKSSLSVLQNNGISIHRVSPEQLSEVRTQFMKLNDHIANKINVSPDFLSTLK